MAAYHWEERVTSVNPRVVNQGAIIGNNQKAQIAYKKAHHTDYQAGNPWLSSY